jgi:hypothetical protein
MGESYGSFRFFSDACCCQVLSHCQFVLFIESFRALPALKIRLGHEGQVKL